jgi:hypothetical protein
MLGRGEPDFLPCPPDSSRHVGLTEKSCENLNGVPKMVTEPHHMGGLPRRSPRFSLCSSLATALALAVFLIQCSQRANSEAQGRARELIGPPTSGDLHGVQSLLS